MLLPWVDKCTGSFSSSLYIKAFYIRERATLNPIFLCNAFRNNHCYFPGGKINNLYREKHDACPRWIAAGCNQYTRLCMAVEDVEVVLS